MPCQLHGITSQRDENIKKDTNISFQQSYDCSMNSQATEVFSLFFSFFWCALPHFHDFQMSISDKPHHKLTPKLLCKFKERKNPKTFLVIGLEMLLHLRSPLITVMY